MPATKAQVDEVIETSAGRMTKTQASYKVSLDIWIQRFRTAQGEIRKLESENSRLLKANEKLKKISELALEQLTDEQVIAITRIVNETPAGS